MQISICQSRSEVRLSATPIPGQRVTVMNRLQAAPLWLLYSYLMATGGLLTAQRSSNSFSPHYFLIFFFPWHRMSFLSSRVKFTSS